MGRIRSVRRTVVGRFRLAEGGSGLEGGGARLSLQRLTPASHYEGQRGRPASGNALASVIRTAATILALRQGGALRVTQGTHQGASLNEIEMFVP